MKDERKKDVWEKFQKVNNSTKISFSKFELELIWSARKDFFIVHRLSDSSPHITTVNFCVLKQAKRKRQNDTNLNRIQNCQNLFYLI